MTYLYTYSDIILFSYLNGTQFNVYNSTNGLVWSGAIDKGGHQVLSDSEGIDEGIFSVEGTDRYSVLVGDAGSYYIMGYYAIDKDGKGMSNNLYTYQVKHYFFNNQFAVFGYENSTLVNISNSITGEPVWSGTLNESEHYSNTTLADVFLTVNASKPVSALSYSDQGYYIPSSDGFFAGKKFYSYAMNNNTPWPGDLNVVAYYDNTMINVTDTNTSANIWNGSLNAGQFNSIPFSSERYVTITSDKNINAGVFPYHSYTSPYLYYIYAQDLSGTGIGNLFYFPALPDGNMVIFSYSDNTTVNVTSSSGSELWSGNLNLSESHAILIPSKDIYKITGSNLISCVYYYGDNAGSDFAPQYYLTENTTPVVNLTSPVGGENWNIGSVHPVTWNTTGGLGSLNMSLFYSTTGINGTYSQVAAGLSDTGSYAWTVPSPATTNASVKIIANDSIGRSVNDTSNTVFTISTASVPSVNLTCPNGGENWNVGSLQNITWLATGGIGSLEVNLTYSTTGINGTYSQIASGLSNSGLYSWLVPSPPTNNASVQVHVSDGTGQAANDTSDSVFSISTASVPSVNLTCPNGGENWNVGSVQNITWLATGGSGSLEVNLLYSTTGINGTYSQIASGLSNSGLYSWIVPLPQTKNASVQVHVSDAIGQAANDTSDSVFSINQGSLWYINATSSTGGNITPSGLIPVANGADQTFHLVADSGYHIRNLTVDNSTAIIDAGTYTFTNVTANHTIRLFCDPNTGGMRVNFTQNLTTGTIPLSVQFTDTTTGSPDYWFWAFGDGNWSRSQNPVHTYTAPGIRTVRLFAGNLDLHGIKSKVHLITVRPPAEGITGPSAENTTEDLDMGEIPGDFLNLTGEEGDALKKFIESGGVE